MDGAKKRRNTKGLLVSRHISELRNGIQCQLPEVDIEEKIGKAKEALDEVLNIHEEFIGLMEDEGADATIDEEENWYQEVSKKVDVAVKEARTYLQTMKDDNVKEVAKDASSAYKLKKLECPTFKSDPKQFHRWRETFERFTAGYNDETRYDYLFSHTEGESHCYVANRKVYSEAILKIEEKYGNVHDIVAILIDEVKSLAVTRRGDFSSFENLELKVNDFHDRLVLMKKEAEVENSYILKELEEKLCSDGLQKWLESTGDAVDSRTVMQLMKWMETQTRLRRMVGRSTNGPTVSQSSTRRSSGYVSNAEGIIGKCALCSGNHELESCNNYTSLPLYQKWERLKQLRICFICLRTGHQRRECGGSMCQVCSGPHHTSLHSYRTQEKAVNSTLAPTGFTSNSCRQDSSQHNKSPNFLMKKN